MKNNRSIAVLVITALAFFGLGALSDSLVESVSRDLYAWQLANQNYASFWSNYPTAEAYFRGRAEGFETARMLLTRASDRGTDIPEGPFGP